MFGPQHHRHIPSAGEILGTVAEMRPRRRFTSAMPPCTSSDPALEEIGFADEVGDEAIGRSVVDLPGIADLQDLAGRHHGDAVRHGQRFFLVMGDEDEGDAGFRCRRFSSICMSLRSL
jgi:hypothetical protein